MREILFRGKRRSNGKWVDGFYLKHTTKTGERLENFIYEPYTDTEYNVIPETIGQFTSLTDNNGKKIFEGDIIRWTDLENNVTERPVIYDHEWNLFVVYIDGALKYGVNKYLGTSGIDVIGNIHDK